MNILIKTFLKSKGVEGERGELRIDQLEWLLKQFSKHLLEEAAENALLKYDEDGIGISGVDKQSITETLNKYL